MITIWLQLLELLQNSSFVKKLLREAPHKRVPQKVFMTLFFIYYLFIYLFFFSRT